MGLAFEIPGISVLQRTLRLFSTFHSTTAPCPSPLPAALSPLNPGHGLEPVRAAGFGEAGSGLAAGVLAAAFGAAFGDAAGAAAATRSNACVPFGCVSVSRSMVPFRPAN